MPVPGQIGAGDIGAAIGKVGDGHVPIMRNIPAAKTHEARAGQKIASRGPIRRQCDCAPDRLKAQRCVLGSVDGRQA